MGEILRILWVSFIIGEEFLISNRVNCVGALIMINQVVLLRILISEYEPAWQNQDIEILQGKIPIIQT